MTTEPITDEALAAIKAGLEGVTDGPWVARPWGDGSSQTGSLNVMSDVDEVVVAANIMDGNALHIARMDPATVASLIARVERAEETRAEALNLMSEASREAGEWKGRYGAAGYPGTLDGWIARAEVAEARVKALEEAALAVENAGWFRAPEDAVLWEDCDAQIGYSATAIRALKG